jgi:hypothetical protein
VRRDNIEHLLMIGGPNDLVVEAEIIRAESRELRPIREARARDKEPREKDQRDTPPGAAGASWPSPAEAPPLGAPPRTVPAPPAAALVQEAVAGRAAEEATPALAAVIAGLAPKMPPNNGTPRGGARAADRPGQRPAAQRRPLLGVSEPPSPEADLAKGVAAPARPPAFLRPSSLRPLEKAKPVLGGEPAAPAAVAFAEASSPSRGAVTPLQQGEPQVAAPAVRGEDVPAAPAPDVAALAAGAGQADQEIDEELARLLGRGPG